jgi:hypothetical protein
VILVISSSQRPSSEQQEAERGSPFVESLLRELGEDRGSLSSADLPPTLSDCLTAGPRVASTPTTPTQRAEQLRQLAIAVEQIRGLEFVRPVRPHLLEDEEFRRRVRRMVLQGYTPPMAEADSRILAALGMIRPSTDMRRLITRQAARAVSGFYDPQTERLYVRAKPGDLGVNERLTLVHELQHAVAHQVLGLPQTESLAATAQDRGLAERSLVEGDAMLTMWRYALTLPAHEQQKIEDPLGIKGEPTEGIPGYIAREILFPYGQGLEFVCELYRRGGWEAVNHAYSEPPASTLEVLFPQRFYPGFAAGEPREAHTLRPPWRLAAIQEFGAADLLLLFRAGKATVYEGVTNPLMSVERWRGSQIRLWVRGPNSAMTLAFREAPGRSELCLNLIRWYAGMFPEAKEVSGRLEDDATYLGATQDAIVRCDGGGVLLAIAPNIATARRLVG